jgi:hypothetical protein
MVDQSHVAAGVPGRRGFRREVLISAAGTKRIGGHEKQHHASMRNYRLPQDANHRRDGIRQPPGAERRIFAAGALTPQRGTGTQILQFCLVRLPVAALIGA